MVDPEGGELHAVFLQHDDRVLALGNGEGAGLDAGGRRRHDFRAVVAGAVAGIERIGLGEAGRDALDARGTVQLQRGRQAAAAPALQRHIAQAVDVVGMEVGQQDDEVASEQAHAAHRAAGGLAGVHNEHALAGDHRRAGAATIVVGEGPACAADGDVDAVGQRRNDGIGHGRRQAAFHDPQGDLAPHDPRAGRDQNQQDQ